MENAFKQGFLPRIIELESVGSTNEYAGELLTKHIASEGTVVWAHRQEAGKGQGSNTWESEPGMNLTFTIVLRPLFLAPEWQFRLNKAISMGVMDFINTLNLPVKTSLKWPNDIYAGTCKLGGILINNIISGTEYSAAIAGIGLNINQVEFSSDVPNPVSLKQLTGKTYSVHTCLDGLLECLSGRYLQLQTGDEQKLDSDYETCLLGFNEESDYFISGKKTRGIIRGVDGFGRLLVQIPDQGLVVFNHNEIGFSR